MKFDIKGNPSYGEVDVDLGPGEVILVEPGAMSRMSSNMSSSFQRQGGLLSAMFRRMFGGERPSSFGPGVAPAAGVTARATRSAWRTRRWCGDLRIREPKRAWRLPGQQLRQQLRSREKYAGSGFTRRATGTP